MKIKVKDNGKTSTKKSSKVVLKDKYAIYTGKAIKIGKAKVTGRNKRKNQKSGVQSFR